MQPGFEPKKINVNWLKLILSNWYKPIQADRALLNQFQPMLQRNSLNKLCKQTFFRLFYFSTYLSPFIGAIVVKNELNMTLLCVMKV